MSGAAQGLLGPLGPLIPVAPRAAPSGREDDLRQRALVPRSGRNVPSGSPWRSGGDRRRGGHCGSHRSGSGSPGNFSHCAGLGPGPQGHGPEDVFPAQGPPHPLRSPLHGT